MGYKPSSRLDLAAAACSGRPAASLGEGEMDRKERLGKPIGIARAASVEPTRALRRPAPGQPLASPAPRADTTWQASSFDLAQGLEVTVMNSKLSPETLDRLFRG
jgi:hypothetical protein